MEISHTSNGIVLVRDQRMKDFLRDTEARMRRQIPPSEIEKWFGVDVAEAIEFLKQYSVLREKRPFNFHVGEVSFVTNCGEVGRIVDSTMSPDLKEWSYLEFDDDTPLMDEVNRVVGKDVMLSVFLNPYSRRLATLIRDAILRAPNNLLLMSYTYNNCLYIDSLYQSKLRIPLKMITGCGGK
ncbi:MAG: McbB family protein [Sulfobacillus sp.]